MNKAEKVAHMYFCLLKQKVFGNLPSTLSGAYQGLPRLLYLHNRLPLYCLKIGGSPLLAFVLAGCTRYAKVIKQPNFLLLGPSQVKTRLISYRISTWKRGSYLMSGVVGGIGGSCGLGGLWTSTGVILVLFILLVIISRGCIW
ncbi:hypothetical protein DQX05_09795 [Paenibacillus thiaminolyticus]|uniref:Uncharacterized protein n=1 Tax=Paenibacillus thiaminolyticus TaxID=49283 RepID=A0A3A3GL87_PANTH|nr:hypothetical protein DQX05_09795 [Paenibacillus thiaminolyticus]